MCFRVSTAARAWNNLDKNVEIAALEMKRCWDKVAAGDGAETWLGARTEVWNARLEGRWLSVCERRKRRYI